MLNYWILYDQSTGVIYPALKETQPTSTGMGVLGPYSQDTAPTDVVLAYTYPSRYLVQSGVLTLQPYLTSSYANGTLTITLNNPPSSPPTSCTVTVGTSAETVALSSNTGTLTMAVHPSVAAYSLPAQVTATGCVGTSVDLGSGQAAPIALQMYTPSGGSLTVGPVGKGSQAFLQGYRLGALPPQTVFQDLLVVVSAMAHVLTHDLIPQATAKTWVPVTVDASALTDWQQNIEPNLPVTFANSLSMPQYAELRVRVAGYLNAANEYAADVNDIPNLG